MADFSNAKVSIITPLYNSEKFIGETIESVARQTHQNWEHLIIDDCSTDASYAIAKRYAEVDPRVKLFRNAVNSGVSESRNLGLQSAEGEFIAFIDSDDLWEPHKLEVQLNMLHDENGSLAYSSYLRVNEQGKVLNRVEVPSRVTRRKMRESNFIPLLTALVKAHVIKENDHKFESFVKNDGREDYVFWLNILKDENIVAVGIDEELARYRVRESSISSSKLKSAYFQWIVYRKHFSMSLVDSLRYMFLYAANGIRKTSR